MRIVGPAVVEERESTAIIWPGDHARVDAYGSIVVQIGEEARDA
jgi:N-methylhydantoinase A/oxoprolinase/acetone carboxylase beta subunit